MLNRLLRKLNLISCNTGLVLMYHRIHNDPVDPWQLSVSPDNFEQQLKVLKHHFNVIPVAEFVKQQQARKLEKNSICLTFDDGYADNYYHAQPLLVKYNLPATFFIPSAIINTNSWFWWDELAALILGIDKLPGRLTLRFSGEVFRIKIPTTQRYAEYLSIWQQLQPLPQAEIQDNLRRIRLWAAAVPSLDNESYPMTSKQLANLFSNPLFSAGIHTAHHPALAFESPEKQKSEILECSGYLEQFAKGQSLPIAYPYGSFNNHTLSIVHEMNLLAGFTTNPTLIHMESNPLTFGRFQAKDCGGAEFRSQLKTWFSKACLIIICYVLVF